MNKKNKKKAKDKDKDDPFGLATSSSTTTNDVGPLKTRTMMNIVMVGSSLLSRPFASSGQEQIAQGVSRRFFFIFNAIGVGNRYEGNHIISAAWAIRFMSWSPGLRQFS